MKTITYFIPSENKTIGHRIVKARNKYEIIGQIADYYFICVNGSQIAVSKTPTDFYDIETQEYNTGGDIHNEYERVRS